MCKALLGMHAFTGCDTVRAFAEKCKIRALTILKANAEFKEAFAELGVGLQWNFPNLHVKLEEFVYKLYATRPATTSFDALRYNLFCARKGDAESHQLPPFQDCLRKHTIANYQAAIWRRILINDPETPDPVGTGGNSRSNN